MKLVKLNDNEFKKYADNHEQITFHQTIQWANLKKHNGWEHDLIGLKDEKEIKAAALLLRKKIPIINKYMYYSPRGFLIDYKNKELLEEFTTKLKKYIKENKGIFVKIDPYVEYKSHDNNGNITDRLDNTQIINYLKDLGYKHMGFNLMQTTLQPRWMHVINTNRNIDDILKDMESKTRQILHKNEKSAIHTREIKKDEIRIFKDIMQKTADRREFVDRPLSYYENMWDELHNSGILKIVIAEIDFNEFKNNTKNEIDENQKELDDRTYKHDNNLLKMNEKKYNQSNKQNQDNIDRLKKQIDKIDDYIKEYGNKKVLGGILFLIYKNEVLSLFGGTEDNVMNFQSAYSCHYWGIKYAQDHNYKKYNFYGITGDFNEKNPLYGLYLFKKSFGGYVVELIGEFDLIISPFWYNTYKLTYKIYHTIKKLKH